MKLYKVIDNQGTSFMIDTWETPMTMYDLRKRFWALGDCHTDNFNDFTGDYIQEMWDVYFNELKEYTNDEKN